MKIEVVAIWYSGIFMGFLTREFEGEENKFLGHIHMFARRNSI